MRTAATPPLSPRFTTCTWRTTTRTAQRCSSSTTSVTSSFQTQILPAYSSKLILKENPRNKKFPRKKFKTNFPAKKKFKTNFPRKKFPAKKYETKNGKLWAWNQISANISNSHFLQKSKKTKEQKKSIKVLIKTTFGIRKQQQNNLKLKQASK